MAQITRLDYTDVIPMTVQNIMLEHMENCGLSRHARNDALIAIAQEMKQFQFCVKDMEATT